MECISLSIKRRIRFQITPLSTKELLVKREIYLDKRSKTDLQNAVLECIESILRDRTDYTVETAKYPWRLV